MKVQVCSNVGEIKTLTHLTMRSAATKKYGTVTFAGPGEGSNFLKTYYSASY